MRRGTDFRMPAVAALSQCLFSPNTWLPLVFALTERMPERRGLNSGAECGRSLIMPSTLRTVWLRIASERCGHHRWEERMHPGFRSRGKVRPWGLRGQAIRSG